MKISGVDIRPGNIIEYEGGIWRAGKIQHTQPGKGGAYMQVELKNLIDGRKNNVRFRSAETVERVRLDTTDFQFLFRDGDSLTFMDKANYEQITLPHADLEAQLPYMQPSSEVTILLVNGRPSSVDLPAAVELAVVETEPGVKGDTVSNVTKPATLETGAVVQVPLFVNVGDRIKVDTREARYISRA